MRRVRRRRAGSRRRGGGSARPSSRGCDRRCSRADWRRAEVVVIERILIVAVPPAGPPVEQPAVAGHGAGGIVSGAATTRAIARQGDGTGVGEGCEYGPAIPSNCSEAAAVRLEPSMRPAIVRDGPRMNAPSASVASPPLSRRRCRRRSCSAPSDRRRRRPVARAEEHATGSPSRSYWPRSTARRRRQRRHVGDREVEVQRVEEAGLLQVGGHLREDRPSVLRRRRVGGTPGRVQEPDREAVPRRVVVVQRDADLLEVVRALVRRAASRAACTAGSSSAIRTAMIAMTTRARSA